MRLLPALLLFSGLSYAQLPAISFDLITDRDGLPSRSVTCAAEDSSGFMWFGTRKCLSRYDGYTFQRVVNENVFGVAATPTGTMYCSTEDNELVRVTNNGFTIKPLVGNAPGGAYNTFIDSFGQVWFSDRAGVNRYDPATNRTYRYPMRKTTYVYTKGSFAEDSQHNVWILGMEVGLFKFDRKTNKLICKLGLDCPSAKDRREFEFHRGFIDKDDRLWVAVVGRGLLMYDTKTENYKTYGTPNGVLLTVCEGADEQGKRILWVGSDSGLGIFRPDTEQFFFFDHLIPRKYEVHDVVQSHRTGIFWICTSEGILKYDPHNQFIKTNRIAANNQPVNAMLADKSDPTGQTVWLAVAFQGLYKWNRVTNKTQFYKFPQYGNLFEATWLIQDHENRLWVGGNQWQSWQDGKGDATDNRFEGVFRFDPAAGRFLETPFQIHHTFFSVPFYSAGMIDRKGRFWLANHYESVHVLDPNTNRELRLWPASADAQLFADNNWVMSMLEDSRGRIWLTTSRGFFVFDEAAHTFRHIKTEAAMLALAEAPDGNFWAVGWHALMKLDNTGRIRRIWTDKDGLYDGECRRVLVDGQNRVWLGTFDGLHLLNEKKNTFRRFTLSDGLLSSNTMMGMTLAGSHDLLVGNVDGWNTLNATTLDTTRAVSRVRLTDMRINNQDRAPDWSRPVVLEPDETALRFGFSALNYRKANDNQYAYYLEGLDEGWVEAGQTHQAFYSRLGPGSYVFHARLGGATASEQLRLPFRIQPYWYQTTWSKLLALAILGSLLGYFFLSRRRYRNLFLQLRDEEDRRKQTEVQLNEKEAAYQLKLSQTEMAALRSQMNPHFIFNCLNSIQFFTAQNDTAKASDYLARFSRLIRLVLENSRSEHVTLANELETLQLYIDMEAMRFQQKVNSQIIIDDTIDTDAIQIPPLLLQPFVENAIWHGLMHKPEGGTVTVRVTQPLPNRLHVEISDDGVGRAKAAEFRSKSATKNKSMGMKVTAERITLINQLYNTQTEVAVLDLFDADNRPSGTRVSIDIPV